MNATLQHQQTIGGKPAYVTFSINGDESTVSVNINETTTDNDGIITDQLSVSATRRQGVNTFNSSIKGTPTLDDQIAVIRAVDTWLNTNSERIINLINTI